MDRLPPMGAAGRLAAVCGAARTDELRVHLYLEQPKLLSGATPSGSRISSGGDGDLQGFARASGHEREEVCRALPWSRSRVVPQ